MFFDNGGPGVRPTTPTYTCSGTTPSNQHVRDVDPRWREVAKDIKMMFRAVLRQDGDEVTHLPRSWNNFGGPQTSREHDSQCATFHGMLHKFKLSRLVASCGEFAILRISSGDFFPEQCRKLVAAALCVHRGWLPPDFLSTATRPDVVLSIPSAPSHAICLEECRFFHWERSNGEGRLSNEDTSGDLLQHCARVSEECPAASWNLWLHHLETVDAPLLRQQLDGVRSRDALASGATPLPRAPLPTTACPSAYVEILALLR
ncbi:unnamed protein product [Prorocentrum cordatum]|nr:unnamed protein product [Polarella glacialis]